MLATGISLAGGFALFVAPWGDQLLSGIEALRLALFLVTGMVISGLAEALYRTTKRWRHAENEKEHRVLQERNRMAREIHDTLAQGLTGIIIQLEAAQDNILDDIEEAERHVVRAHSLARESLSEARRSVRALRPQILEDRDIAFALREYVEKMAEGTSVNVRFTIQGTPPPELRRLHEVESNLLRIGLEAFTNTLKHSRAENVEVMLDFERERVRLTVSDDGIGFSPSLSAGTGFGLITMQERAARIGGEITISSHIRVGTSITVSVPLVAPSSAQPLPL
jgi:signal transduction histidine kinase